MAEQELSENEMQLGFAANAVPALLSYVDAGARYVWCNESYRRWFGYEPDSLRGRHSSDVLGENACKRSSLRSSSGSGCSWPWCRWSGW